MENSSQLWFQSPAFWIAVVIGIVIIATIALLRGNLSAFRFNICMFKGKAETRKPTIEISDVYQSGEKNLVETERDDANIKNIKQKGKGHKLSVKKK